MNGRLICCGKTGPKLVILETLLPANLLASATEKARQCVQNWMQRVTNAGQTKLTTLATVNVPWRNFCKSRHWNKVPDRSTIIFEDNQICL